MQHRQILQPFTNNFLKFKFRAHAVLKLFETKLSPRGFENLNLIIF